MEILSAEKLDSLIQTLGFVDSEAERLEDPALRKFLEYIHIIGQLEAKALEGKNHSLNIESLFYSRYYWFIRFKERYIALYGNDEGLEQQSFKMISDYNERFPGKIDWNVIEQIERNLN